MIAALLAFTVKRPGLAVIAAALVGGLLLGLISGTISYWKGRIDGKAIAEAACEADKAAAAKQNIKVREKNDQIRNTGVTPVEYIDRMFNGKL